MLLLIFQNEFVYPAPWRSASRYPGAAIILPCLLAVLLLLWNKSCSIFPRVHENSRACYKWTRLPSYSAVVSRIRNQLFFRTKIVIGLKIHRYLYDITTHLNILNLLLQGKHKVIAYMYDSSRSRWDIGYDKLDSIHFPTLNSHPLLVMSGEKLFHTFYR